MRASYGELAGADDVKRPSLGKLRHLEAESPQLLRWEDHKRHIFANLLSSVSRSPSFCCYLTSLLCAKSLQNHRLMHAACRHVEASAVLCSICTIDIGYFDHALAFLSSIPPLQLEQIRTLHICGFRWPPVRDSQTGNALGPNTATWDKLCQLLRGLRTLRDLRISLTNDDMPKDRVAELFNEVKGIEMLGTFVLQIPPVDKARNWAVPAVDEPEDSGKDDGGIPRVAFRLERRGWALPGFYFPGSSKAFYPKGPILKPQPPKSMTTPLWERCLHAPFIVYGHYARKIKRRFY